MSNLLNIGKTGLDAARKSLRTTSHNMANVNTEGYSRQRVKQQANMPIEQGGLIQGSGVRVKSIDRISDNYAEKRLEKANSQVEYFESRNQKLSEVETIFTEIDSAGFNKVLNDFYNSFRELANQPEDITMRTIVLDKAKLVVKDIKQVREMLDDVSRSVDERLKHDVQHINVSLEQLKNLNTDIKKLEVSGQETGDLRDQRDLLTKDLAKYFEINTYEDDRGDYNVDAKGVGTLISGSSYLALGTAAYSRDLSSNNMPNSIDIFIDGRQADKITNKFKSGQIGAMAEIRNVDVKGLQEGIDRVAFQLANTVNSIHRRGYVNRRVELDETGAVPTSDRNGPVTGINFFNTITSVAGAAENLAINQYIKDDANNIATALEINKPGDNRVAIAISKLQHEKIAGEGSTSLEEEYLQMVGKVGLEKGKAQLSLTQADALRAQANQIREQYSGVSLDEEAVNLIKYQQAYEASAKVMKTAEEMFQTILNIKR